MAHNVQYIVDDTNKLMSLIFRACADKAHQAIQLGCFSLRSGVEDGISVNSSITIPKVCHAMISLDTNGTTTIRSD